MHFVSLGGSFKSISISQAQPSTQPRRNAVASGRTALCYYTDRLTSELCVRHVSLKYYVISYQDFEQYDLVVGRGGTNGPPSNGSITLWFHFLPIIAARHALLYSLYRPEV